MVIGVEVRQMVGSPCLHVHSNHYLADRSLPDLDLGDRRSLRKLIDLLMNLPVDTYVDTYVDT